MIDASRHAIYAITLRISKLWVFVFTFESCKTTSDC
jgi:hypothetical protein